LRGLARSMPLVFPVHPRTALAAREAGLGLDPGTASEGLICLEPESYLDLVGRLRAAVPGISLTSDIIVGFCGETDAQFAATLELLRKVRFDQVFAAAYSPRPGTPAMRLDDDVPALEKKRRLNELLAAQETIGLELNEAWLGRRTEVLVDEARQPRVHDHEAAGDREPGPRLVGRTREHKLVHFDGPAELVGSLVNVEIERTGPYALSGRMDRETSHA
jgi:tRNA-2-methylthio-N6-dimethylallyladenosine synthase